MRVLHRCEKGKNVGLILVDYYYFVLHEFFTTAVTIFSFMLKFE